MTRRVATAAFALAIGLLLPVAPAWAGGDGDFVGTSVGRGGIMTGASVPALGNLGKGNDLLGHPYTVPMEFSVRVACASTGAVNGVGCLAAVLACTRGGAVDGIGMLYEILARPRGSSAAWQLIGTTCFADHVPGSGPVLSMAEILHAFRLTPWATGSIATQPEGNTTLVGLATFFRVG